MSGEHTNDSHIIITKNIQKFKDFDWIHNNTIFNTLTNEPALHPTSNIHVGILLYLFLLCLLLYTLWNYLLKESTKEEMKKWKEGGQ